MFKKIIIGSRASNLAKAQVRIFEELLKSKQKHIVFKKKFIRTTGDKVLDKKLYEIGNKSLFTKEIDEAHIENQIDVSVHSLKDLQYKLFPGLEIACYLPRGDFRDGFISNNNVTFDKLKKNAIIGTSSIRREIQLRLIRKDLRFESIRGNIETRIMKLKDRRYDAIILAMAGINRLGIRINISPLNTKNIIPSVGQGTIAVICKKKDKELLCTLRSISDSKTELESKCERSFLEGIQGSCDMPIGALAQARFEKIYFSFFVSNPSTGFLEKGERIFTFSSCLDQSYSLGEKIRMNNKKK
tara:strand:- start:3043 stop:3942 length:900 start_codon:yes stop_codon:yes gene_type:complete